MKYCKIWSMAFFAIGAAVGALGAPPKGDYQLYGTVLGGDTDWRIEAEEAAPEAKRLIEKYAEQSPTDKLFIKFYKYLFRAPALELLEYKSNLNSPMHNVKMRLQGVTLSYDAECLLDRRSQYNFTDLKPGIYTLSFFVEQPGIVSDEKRKNNYSIDIELLQDRQNKLDIFCWDIFVPVKGRVVNAKGEPVVGARVRAFRSDPAVREDAYPYDRTQEAWTTQTDPDGYYHLTLPSYYPFDYALFQKKQTTGTPFYYYIAASAPGYEIGSTSYFHPVNMEIRSIAERMAADLPTGSYEREEEIVQRFCLPEKDLVLLCPDIHLQYPDPEEHPEIKDWRERDAYRIYPRKSF